jgi:hypothetical protein
MDLDGSYQPENFVIFPHDGGGWSQTDYWRGNGWDWFNGNPPWTEIYQTYQHPNSPNGFVIDPGNPARHEHWAIRRWISNVEGNLNLMCHLKFRKQNATCGDGVKVYVFREGTMVYSNSIAYNDTVGRDDLIYLPDVTAGARIDIALAPGNTDSCDRTYLSATIFSRPAALVRDFALQTPLAMAMPVALEFEVVEGKTKTKRLTLQNLGGLDLEWTLRDSAANQGAAPEGAGSLLYRHDSGSAIPNNAGDLSLAYPMTFRWQPAQPSAAPDILIYADDYYHSPPYTYLDQALQRLALPYVACYYGDWSAFEAALAIGGWDFVLVGNDSYAPPLSTLDALNSYVIGGGKLIYHGWTVSGSPSHPLWTALGFSWQGDDFDPPSPVYWWNAAHLIFNDPETVPPFTVLSGGRYGIYGQYVEPLSGFEALAGYTSSGSAPNQAGLILGNQNRTVFKGFLDGQNDADRDADGVRDGIELWVNLIAGIQSGFGDLAWLTESPASGALPPGQPQQIHVTVDASNLPPGNYSASLILANNSGRREKLVVPVRVKVMPFTAAVNAGGPNYTDTLGREWSADQVWDGVDWGYLGNSSSLSTTTPIAATADPLLFATARQGQFEYVFSLPKAGTYQVELRFAEIQGLKAGARVFDVLVEGETVLPHHDIAYEAGKYKADNHSCLVNVTDGQLNIRFLPLPGKKLPLVNAILVTRQP